jgi:gliding motility-associated-like protein
MKINTFSRQATALVALLFMSFTSYAQDIGVVSIESPASGCNISTDQVVTVSVRNFGIISAPAAGQINMSYSFNGGPQVTENWGTSIPPNTTVTFTFSVPIDEAGIVNQTYTISATANHGLDGTPGNNTTVSSFESYPLTIGGTLVGSATHCAGDNSGLVTLSDSEGCNLGWESSTNSGTSWSPIVNTSDSQPYSDLTQTTWFRVKVQSGCGEAGSCPLQYSDTAIVTINPIPSTPSVTSNGPLCEGQNLMLTSNSTAGATYVWIGPSFTSTEQNPTRLAATPAATGNYKVAATLSNCVSDTSSIIVTVNSVPLSLNPASNTPVCEGASLNLTADLSTGSTYAWTGPGYTSNSQNPTRSNVFPGTHAGIYSVSATRNGCTGPITDIVVEVNAKPSTPLVSSNSPICAGQNLILTSTSDAGATYSWTSTNFSSSSQDTTRIDVSEVDGGNYFVTSTLNGCNSATAFTVVSIKSTPIAPVPTSNTPVCESSSINLTIGTAVKGGTYNWSGPLGYAASVQSPSITNSVSGNDGDYEVVVTVDGCTSLPGTTNLEVKQKPGTAFIESNSAICEGQDLNLTARFIEDAIFAWTGPNGFTSGDEDPVITDATTSATGTYSCTITIDGCTSDDSTLVATVKPKPVTPAISSNSPLCEGQTLNLTTPLVSSATYAWSGPSFLSSAREPSIASVTTAETGTYDLAVTVNGCVSDSSFENVVVNATPAAPFAGNNGPVCEGTDLNLTATPVTGASFAWTGPNGFTSDNQNPVINNVLPAQGGDYFVRATSGGCQSAPSTTNVVVIPKPVFPTAGSNGPICEGENLNLVASNHANTTYSWTGPNAYTSTTQNPTIVAATTINSGIYYLTTIKNGCVSDTASTNGNVNAIPTTPAASSNTPVCEGSDLMLTTPAQIGAIYNWSGPNSFISTTQNPIISNVTLAANGVYNVIITIKGCTSSPGSTSVTVVDRPIQPTGGSNSPVCIGTNLSLNVNSVGGAIYSWTGPNGFSSNLQNPTITGVNLNHAGDYFITTTVNNCTSVKDTVPVIVRITPTPIATSNAPICSGSDLELMASFVNDATYNWVGSNGFTSGLQNPTRPGITPLDAGVYSVTVTVDGCTGPTGQVNVVVDVETVPGNVFGDTSVCAGTNSGPLSLLNNNGSVVQWEYSTNGVVSWVQMSGTSNGNAFGNLTETTYFRALIKNGACSSAYSTHAVISVTDGAQGGNIVNGSIDPELLICPLNNSGNLFIENYVGYVDHWEFSDDKGLTWTGDVNNTDNYQYSNIEFTRWYRTIVGGCNSMDTSEVYVLKVNQDACDKITVANLLTPNNDAKNDTWLIDNLESLPTLDVKIFNRLGKEVYSNADYDNTWNGEYQGTPLPDGTYYYVINVSGSERVLTGPVNILK